MRTRAPTFEAVRGEREHPGRRVARIDGQIQRDRVVRGVGVDDPPFDRLGPGARPRDESGVHRPGGDDPGVVGGCHVDPAGARAVRGVGGRPHAGAHQGVLDLLPRPVGVLLRQQDGRAYHVGAAMEVPLMVW